MSVKSSTGREAGSAARKPRALERLLIVAAVAAVLVALGAWFAMTRPGSGAEAAGAGSSATATGGSAADASAGTATGDPAASTASESPAAASADAPTGQGSSGGTAASAAPTSAATAPLSPTTAFLTALTESGLAPPIDDTQKLAMADDVCQELGNGSTYADVVRALTFAGASDAEAANFAGLAITHLCSQYEIG